MGAVVVITILFPDASRVAPSGALNITWLKTKTCVDARIVFVSFSLQAARRVLPAAYCKGARNGGRGC